MKGLGQPMAAPRPRLLCNQGEDLPPETLGAGFPASEQNHSLLPSLSRKAPTQ